MAVELKYLVPVETYCFEYVTPIFTKREDVWTEFLNKEMLWWEIIETRSYNNLRDDSTTYRVIVRGSLRPGANKDGEN